MRQIEPKDIAGAKRLILSKYFGGSSSVCRDDFVAAGMLGLVYAAHEFDEKRDGWGSLWRWRAQQCARELMRWAQRTESDASIDADIAFVAAPRSEAERCPEADQRDAIFAALRHVTGNVKHAIARAAWIDGESCESLAARFGVCLDTIHSHLKYARKQVAEAMADGRIDPALRGVGRELAAEYAKLSRPGRVRRRAGAAR